MSFKFSFGAAALAGSLLLQPAVFGQQGGAPAPAAPSAPAPGGGPVTTPNNPGRTPSRQPNIPTVPQQEQQQPRFDQRPIYLSGTVVVQGGGAPPDRAVIESVCNGSRRIEGYTDSKGRFSLQLGQQNNGVFQDASVGRMDDMNSPFGNQSVGTTPSGFNSSSDRLLLNCELQARLPGYRSDVVSLANRRALDNPDVGTIFLEKLGPVEGLVVSATNMAAPKEARKAFEKGDKALKNKKPEDALKNLQKAVEAYPQYASAWSSMADAQMALGKKDEARNSLQQAIKADPKFIAPYLQLANLQAEARQWPDLAATTAQAIKLDPYSEPVAYLLNAIANYNINNIDAAEKSARAAAKMDTRHQLPKINHLLGVILASKRDYQGAALQLRSYLQFAPKATDADAVRRQLGEIERMQGVSSLQ
jgi:tetratricopeptide (TPR) repeat protein